MPPPYEPAASRRRLRPRAARPRTPASPDPRGTRDTAGIAINLYTPERRGHPHHQPHANLDQPPAPNRFPQDHAALSTRHYAVLRVLPITIRPLSEADGGGFAIEYPDLPGCISDAETPEEAVRHGSDAVRAYLLDCSKHGDQIPKPSSASGQWRQRVPRSLHSRLVAKARQEEVSLNTLVTAMIAEGLGQRRTP